MHMTTYDGRRFLRSLTVQHHTTWVLCNALLYLVLAAGMGNGMFSYGDADGFYVQMTYIAGLPFSEYEALHYVHLLRLLAVFPFYMLWLAGAPVVLQHVVLLCFMLPIVLARYDGQKRYSSALIIYFGLFVSMRSTLAACSIAYLFILMFSARGHRSGKMLFFVSALLSNLSSGVVLSWLLIMAFYRKELIGNAKWLSAIMLIVVAGLGTSLLHKIGFFGSLSSGASFIYVVIQRSTLVVSFNEGSYIKLVFYLLLLFGVLSAILIFQLFGSRYSKIAPFFVAALPGFFMEGLAAISFSMSIFLLFAAYIPLFSESSGMGVESYRHRVHRKEEAL